MAILVDIDGAAVGRGLAGGRGEAVCDDARVVLVGVVASLQRSHCEGREGSETRCVVSGDMHWAVMCAPRCGVDG